MAVFRTYSLLGAQGSFLASLRILYIVLGLNLDQAHAKQDLNLMAVLILNVLSLYLLTERQS